ncbi:hypothetical protein HOLleu_32242 [Holothuria leucospilota]|uniref:Uncharacterized protein n=1 Tax=Holothuria leucospilota TaxID=206669 RepID=A0A9Q0YSL3_HOLLE|nr:hypothetical protein HOLleu_32242 [Holothuria leucospilota]
MQPRGFRYTIAVFGGSILLLVVLILTLRCLLLKKRRKLSKRDNKNSVKTGELSTSAKENVNIPAHESTEEIRCFPKLDNPANVYNPAYESSDIVVLSDRKNSEDQENLSKKASSSAAPDVREEIYNPAYETSATVKGTTHLYHYVECGTRECQIKTQHLPGESEYHYVDFKGN